MNFSKFLVVGTSLLTAMQIAFAECSINGKEVPCDQIPKWIAFIPLLMIPLFLLAFYFWIKMLLHAIKSQNENKTIWILVIIILQFLGAIVYYFAEKRPADKLLKSGVATTPTTP